MEKPYRDFTVCETCGERCYLGNRFCEDCANELYAVECELNKELPIYQKAYDLVCDAFRDYAEFGFAEGELQERFWKVALYSLTHQHEDKGE